MADLVKQRHESLLRRIFNNVIELYLFDKLIHSTGETSLIFDDFLEYKVSEDIKQKYLHSYSIDNGEEKIEERTIKDIDEKMSKWFRENKPKYNELYKKFKERNEKNKDVIIPFDEFKEVFAENKDRQCHYCGITEKVIDEMILKSKIKTKRLLTRGRTMEIDRIKPNEGYTKDNIVLSCYWCNNAKTDEFSYKEFKSIIAPTIRTIWIERFGKIPEAPGIEKLN
jgi:5-methylcytosine-specific restriction endonuclease McrA